MTTPVCRAKNPSACRYHGTGGEAFANTKRLELTSALTAYQAFYGSNPTSPETYSSYEVLRSAQKNYYATDQGDAYLSECLATGVGNPAEVAELQREARQFRYEAEMRDGGSEWKQQASKPAQPFPVYTNRPAVNGIHPISAVKNDDKSTTHYMWSEKNKTLYVEVMDEHGHYDMDEMRELGRAETKDQALFKAYDFFQRRA